MLQDVPVRSILHMPCHASSTGHRLSAALCSGVSSTNVCNTDCKMQAIYCLLRLCITHSFGQWCSSTLGLSGGFSLDGRLEVS